MKNFKRHRGTFYFFPAFLPLIELAPWLIAAIGAVASAASFSLPKFWRAHKLKIIGFSLICFASALGIYAYAQPNTENYHNGTRHIHPETYPAAYHHRTEEAATTPASTKDPGSGFRPLWTATLPRRPLSSPVIHDGLLVYGTYEDSVEALSVKNGQHIWSLPQDDLVFSLTKGPDGTVYAGEGLHHTKIASMTAIEAKTAKVKWRREFLGHIEELAAFDDNDHMYFTTGPGGVWGLSTKDASVIFHKNPGHTDSRPLVHDGTLYIPAQVDEQTHDTQFFAYDIKSGDLKWRKRQLGQPWGSPILDKTEQYIFTSTGKGQIGITRKTDIGWAYALTIDGKFHWQTTLPNMPLQPATYLPDDNVLIYTTKTGQIVALNTTDGSILWAKESGGDVMGAAEAILDYEEPLLATTSVDGIFIIRKARTGEEIIRRIVSKNTSSSPTADGDTIYVMTETDVTAFTGIKSLLTKAKGL